MKFSGKNVLVTGSSRGIGSQIARILGSYGLKVWINYRNNDEEAISVAKDIRLQGGNAEVLKADVSKEEDFIAALETIVSSDGCFDYLVNNAGITRDKLALRMSIDDFQSVIDANLLSTFLGCREALKIMSKQKFGSIVNISSIIGDIGNIGQVNYSASKGGMNAMTKSFAREGALRGIRFNAIAPGFIATDMTDELKEEVKAEYEKAIPLRRFGNAIEVAEAVAFLLSDHASYITGEILKVNGGLHM